MSTSRTRRHVVCRVSCAISNMMISSATLELMPLHSFAISMLTPGTVKTNPSRRTGTPRREKIEAERSVDRACKKRMTLSIKTLGTGRISTSSEIGKAALLIAQVPKKNTKPAITRETTDNTVNSGIKLEPLSNLTPNAKAAARIPNTAISSPLMTEYFMEAKIASLRDQIKKHTRAGISTM